jgi:putative addiction module component (TIGR02574 family)
VSPREQVLADALALSDDDRLELARDLLRSIEPVELTAEQKAELRESVAALRRGEGIAVTDVDEFIDGLDV